MWGGWEQKRVLETVGKTTSVRPGAVAKSFSSKRVGIGQFFNVLGGISERGELGDEHQFDSPGRTVALFGNDEVGKPFLGSVVLLFSLVLPVQEGDHIGVLFNLPALAKVREPGMAPPFLRGAAELRDRHERNIQFFRQG